MKQQATFVLHGTPTHPSLTPSPPPPGKLRRLKFRLATLEEAQNKCQCLFCLVFKYFLYRFVSWILSILNNLHSNIIMHILHTVHHTFPNVLARRIFLTIKRLFS